jgi:hypothetical protein
METLQEHEYDLYIAEFARNVSLPDDTYDDNVDNDSNIEEIEETEENTRGRGRSRGRGRGRGRGRPRGGSVGRGYGNNNQVEQVVQLPAPPFFNTFQHSKPLHEFTITLPREHQLLLPSPYSIFCLFFSLEQIKIIVKNTNTYAYIKDAGEGRKWKDLTIEEFRIWLAILIYFGIFKLPSIEDFWNKDSRYPEHKITTFMTLLRFEQVLLTLFYVLKYFNILLNYSIHLLFRLSVFCMFQIVLFHLLFGIPN